MLKLIKKQQGFTLLELLVVIAIIGLLASIVLVSYEGSTDKARIAKTLSWAGSVSHLLGDQAVGVWTFDNISGTTVYDDSGNNNNGTISGAAVVDGVVGKALSSNGTGYVNVGSSPLLTPQNITIEAWVKANFLGTWNGIISNMTSWGTGFSLQMGTAQNIAAMISGSYLRTSWVPKINVWYHIVSSHDAVTNLNILYVNGKEENRTTRAVSYEPNAKTYIGVFYTSPSLYFNGLIDDVRIFSEALPQARIEQLYADGLLTHQNLAIR